ncbi:uncharacterized protein LOC113463868 [Ceratina calcarata]|uniref:Uncharacterized protein LOC113463868 n=1 Tax=Ceratina calcarata TaxID=156304 RepID=A0AAJ7W832_9HYME|nr:uncharacterized protein LOC113463868 [Ceratina calcarata]
MAMALNDSTMIEDVPSQGQEILPFDAAGDEFILSTNLEGFEGMEEGIVQEKNKVIDAERARSSSTPKPVNTKVEDGFSHGKERTKGKVIRVVKRHAEKDDDSGIASADKDSSGASSTLAISLPLEEEAAKIEKTPVARQAVRRESHKTSSHGKPKTERTVKK